MTLNWKRANKTGTTNNGNRAIWSVLSNGYKRGWLLVRTLGWKNFIPRELSRNQPIPRFDVILLHDWPIEQCLLYSRVFFGGKTKRPCFDLFNHWLIKQITDTYRNIFQGRYENRSNLNINGALLLHQSIIVAGLGFCSMKFAFMAVPV